MKGRTGKRPAASAPSRTERAPKVADALSRKPGARVARERLVVEMHRLRSLFGEIAQRYTADTEARIAALIATVESGTIPAAKARELLETIWSVDVRPRKGRRKDLGRIERIVDAIERSLAE